MISSNHVILCGLLIYLPAAQADSIKISNSGDALPLSAAIGASADDWACTYDDKTHLLWELKPTDGGLRDRNWTYSWFSSDPLKNGGVAGLANGGKCWDLKNCDTEKFIKQVKAQGLCGVNDWRLPEIAELETYYPLLNDFVDIDNENGFRSYTWSATTSSEDKGKAFASYSWSAFDKSEPHALRLVSPLGSITPIDFKESSWQPAESWSIEAPQSMALAKDGSLFVADVKERTIVNYRADGMVLKTIKIKAGSSEQSFDFKRPVLIAVAPDQTLYLVDQSLQRIIQIDTDGKFLSAFGQKGFVDGQFDEISGIAFAPDGRLYVVDKLSNPPKTEQPSDGAWGSIARVQHFSATGTFLSAFTFGSYMIGPYGSQVTPGKLTVATDGSLLLYTHVMNIGTMTTTSHEVKHFSPNGTQFSGLSVGPIGFWQNGAVALAPDGSLFVTSDTTVQHLGTNGRVLDALPAQFKQADDLLLSADGNLWVADTGNNRIQHWRFNAPVNRYDSSTGEALFENVTVGNEHYWVTLKHQGNFKFTVVKAINIKPVIENRSTLFDLRTGLVTLPKVAVDGQNYDVVLQRMGNGLFVLKSAK